MTYLLSNDAKRSLYRFRTVDKKTGKVKRELGYGYMGQKYTQPSLEEDGGPMLVSSTSVLSDDLLNELKRNPSNELQAVRYLFKNDAHKIIKLDPNSVERCNINKALSFVRGNFTASDEKPMDIKYSITFDYGDPSNEGILHAYVFTNEIIPIELIRDGKKKRFEVAVKKDGFAEANAKGAPMIICRTNEYKAFGFLDFKDEDLQPVFIDERSYKSFETKVPAHNDDEADIKDEKEKGPDKVENEHAGQASGSFKTSGPKTDSPVLNKDPLPHQHHVDTSKDDQIDSPFPIAEEFQQKLSLDKDDIKVTNGQQSIQEEKANEQGKMVPGLHKSQTSTTTIPKPTTTKPKPVASAKASTSKLSVKSAANSILQPVSKCIKNQTLSDASNSHKLLTDLEIRLDPHKPLGDDYRDLADRFGYNKAKRDHLGSLPRSPTIALLGQVNCTISVLRKKLVEMERHDAVGDIDKYIEKQGCDCENCGANVPVPESNRCNSTQNEKEKEQQERQSKVENKHADILLEDLWKDIYFKDELCRTLDVEHKLASQLKNWCHLAHEFNESDDNIPRNTVSPTEALLRRLESTNPGLTVREFCVALEEAKANQVLRLLNKSIEEHKLQHQDLVSEMATKACEVLNGVILKLDKQNLWEEVAKKLQIKENVYSVFTRDPNTNPTRMLFEVLSAHSPSLKVSDMITNLEQLEENYLSSKLSTKFQGNCQLKTLSADASFMYDEIERILNDPTSEMLYKLAGKFKEQGKIKGDFDINVFRPQEDVQSPTGMLIEKVTTSHEKEYTAQDLIVKLRKIERTDCVDLVMEYVQKILLAANEH